jgi:hypothetical protein
MLHNFTTPFVLYIEFYTISITLDIYVQMSYHLHLTACIACSTSLALRMAVVYS